MHILLMHVNVAVIGVSTVKKKTGFVYIWRLCPQKGLRVHGRYACGVFCFIFFFPPLFSFSFFHTYRDMSAVGVFSSLRTVGSHAWCVIPSYRIFARPPERASVSWTSYTRPFSLGLWVCLLLALVLLGILFWAMATWYCWREGRLKSPSNRLQRFRDWKSDASMVMWAAITQQGMGSRDYYFFIIMTFLYIILVDLAFYLLKCSRGIRLGNDLDTLLSKLSEMWREAPSIPFMEKDSLSGWFKDGVIVFLS